MTAYTCIARGSVLRGCTVYRAKGWPWTQRSALVLHCWENGLVRLYVVMRRTLRMVDK